MLNTMKDTNEKAEKAMEALKCMKPGNESTTVMVSCHNIDKDVLIPVSANIMVPGKLENVDHVYVSIGANYVVEKTVDDANQFFSKQKTMLDGSIKSVRSQAMNLEDQLYPVRKMIEIRKLQQQQQQASAKCFVCFTQLYEAKQPHCEGVDGNWVAM